MITCLLSITFGVLVGCIINGQAFLFHTAAPERRSNHAIERRLRYKIYSNSNELFTSPSDPPAMGKCVAFPRNLSFYLPIEFLTRHKFQFNRSTRQRTRKTHIKLSVCRRRHHPGSFVLWLPRPLSLSLWIYLIAECTWQIPCIIGFITDEWWIAQVNNISLPTPPASAPPSSRQIHAHGNHYSKIDC